MRPQTGRQVAFACPMDMYKGSFGTAGAESAAKEASIGEAGGVLEIRVDEQGFHPSRIRVTAGQPSVLRFTRVAENTCSTGVLIPALGIDEEFPFNVPIDVTISPGAIGEISFSCPTKMSTGVIEVVGGDER